MITVFSASIETFRQTSTSCQVSDRWWDQLIDICNCKDIIFEECQLQLLVNIAAKTHAMRCKPDSHQACKDHVFKLAYEYKSSPFADKCKQSDPNYEITDHLKTSCEDGYFR